jgi:hypothetical protein
MLASRAGTVPGGASATMHHWTTLVLYAGLLVFVTGLVTSHVVLFASWGVKKGAARTRRVLRVAMRIAVALFALGLALIATGYFAAR